MQNEIIILIVLIALSAFFSASEMALVQVSKLKARHLLEKNKRGARTLKKLKDDPQRMLITILIGNNVVNITAAAIATKLAIGIFENNAVGIATGVMTFLLLVFGEVTPKSLVIPKYETIALLVARPIWIISIILYPISFLLNLFVKLLKKMFNIKREKPLVTEEELKSYIKAGEEAGSIKEIEKEMIDNIFRFDDVNVEEIMTLRQDMVCLNSSSKLKDALRTIKSKLFLRFPVYGGSKDKIVGILNLKEVYEYLGKKGFFDMKIADMMREPFFVPETKKIDSLLKQFQKRQEHMAIVVDEQGAVSGLVTMEDVLEEIVGEIFDETDRIAPNISAIDNKSWIVMGKTDIGEINEKLKTNFQAEEFESFGGYILNKTGKLPKEKDEIDLDENYKVIIEDVNINRINRVRLVKK